MEKIVSSRFLCSGNDVNNIEEVPGMQQVLLIPMNDTPIHPQKKPENLGVIWHLPPWTHHNHVQQSLSWLFILLNVSQVPFLLSAFTIAPTVEALFLSITKLCAEIC